MTDTEIAFAPPRGMRDFYPEDMVLRNAIFEAWTAAARRFGFLPYDSCVVENLDLLKRKSGEEIVEQIYAFTDKSGRELALRPEMTPTLARMVAARQASISFPIKWCAIAQCFRYERMTRGRKREHFQWNLDIVGNDSVAAEAEVIATAADALRTLGLGPADFRVHFSNRALLGEMLEKLGIDRRHHAATFLALDKRGKISDEEIGNLLRAEGLDEQAVSRAFELLKISGVEDCIGIVGSDSPAGRSTRLFVEMLGAYGISDTATFDISVIRGLTYYTGIVFEAFDVDRKFRAIFGGGRYDNLLSDLGGSPATGVGLGFGDVVIAEILIDKAKTPATRGAARLAVGFMDAAQQRTAIEVASALRRAGCDVDLALAAEKPKSFFSRAGKSGFAEGVYIGPDDVAAGTIRIKDLATRTERTVPIAEAGRS